MVSEFRRIKLMHLYHKFFDQNECGMIDKTDFEMAIEKITTLRGWKPSEVPYERTKELIHYIWAGLQEDGDSVGDGIVTAERWVELWDKYSKNPDSASEWQTAYCKCIFQLEDMMNDGAIDSEEFSTVFELFGFNKQSSIEAFKVMAQGKEKVTYDEFEKLWRQYFISEDPKDPGNYIFGSLYD